MTAEGWGSGWDNQVVSQVIIVGPAGQLLVYSPTEGAGKLIASVSGESGTDPYGNIYLAGVTSYNGVSAAVSIFDGGVQFFTFGGGTWNQFSIYSSSGLTFTSAGDLIQLGSAGELPAAARLFATQTLITASSATFISTDLLEVQGSIATSGDLQAIVSGALETWHGVSFASGFEDAGIGPSVGYQYEPINGGRVRLRGFVQLTSNEGGDATMFTLPAGYRPAAELFLLTPTNLSGYTLGSSSINIQTSGAVQINVNGVTGNIVGLNGVVFPLD